MAELSSAPIEKVAQFGVGRGLVGIVTQPASGPRPGAPGVVILNSGIIHRVGTSRLSVLLARSLAVAGFTVLRFDLSGIGDSERRADVESLRESVNRDIGDAVEYLTGSNGVERVVLMGLCSGAFDAFHAAAVQPRVVGAFMVDIPGPFRGWRHTIHHIAQRIFRRASWMNPMEKLVGHSRALAREIAEERRRGGYVVGGRGASSRARMRELLDALLARQIRLHFAFTAGLEDNYNHRSQFAATFPRAARHPALTQEFFAERDHAFSRREPRERLVRSAVAWARGFGTG